MPKISIQLYKIALKVSLPESETTKLAPMSACHGILLNHVFLGSLISKLILIGPQRRIYCLF